MERFDVLIVGGGHGGAQATIALRQLGFAGSIAIVSQEPDPPYERPPLSKDYLAGERGFERMLIRPLAFWDERRVALRLGRRVVAVEPEARTVRTDGGGGLGYERLVWAAGGLPYRLRCPGGDGANVHVIRSRGDADRLKAALPAARRIAVVGGGYIGLEATAVLRSLGKPVTLVEAADRVLSRVAGEALSRFYEAEHRGRGVDLRTGASIEAIEAGGVRLAGGEIVPADLVIVAIGIGAAAEPLLAAGAKGGDGVAVDEHCRTSLPGIWAVGDCALHANRFAGAFPVRLESVQNAHDQATTAAKAIVGRPEAYDAVPWFWSNQYDLRLQTVGIQRGHDEALLRGDPSARSFSVVYLREGRVVALDCVNAVKDYAQGRRLVAEGVVPDRPRLADPAVPLKDL
jgi:3-phenylpropionate/trans-cinnamate dioxygenase ferredoxin reductase subunit